MLRGNHESNQLSQYFNFENEVINKYNKKIYELFLNCFNSLPLACICSNKFFAIHGGISPEFTTISQLQSINRFVEPPKSGILW